MADKDDLEVRVGINATGAETGGKRAVRSIASVDAVSKDLQRSFRALKSAIDPTFAAQEKYNRSIADAKRLYDAKVISLKEYRAGLKAAEQALNDGVAAIGRNATANKAAVEQKKAGEREAAAAARETARVEAQAAREAARAKIQAAQEARRVQREMEAQEQRAIRLSAQLARQAAVDAGRSARRSGSTQRGVAPGSISTDRSIKQLENDYKRAYEAAQRAAEKATAAAERAATASNSRIGASALAMAEKQKAAAESYQQKATQIARTIASVVGAQNEQQLADEKNFRQQQKAAAQQATQAAIAAARASKAATRDAANAARIAAQETRQLAVAERQAADAAMAMRASIDPNVAAQERYNETMRTATQLLMMNKLKQGEWIAIQKQAKTQMDVNIRSMGRQNSMYVQLGYQAQDVTASLASGINPLVILAQQGGQTAAAMSQMGGKIGQVAAFFAGPWGAAIIGFTMLLGFLWESMKSGETATKDLMNAEDRRKMTVKELADAIKEYVKAQREANETTLEGKLIQANAAMQTQIELMDRLKKEQAELNALEAERDRLMNPGDSRNGMIAALGGIAAYGAALGVVNGKILWQRKQVESLNKSIKDGADMNIEAQAAYVQASTQMTETERREDNEKTAALGRFRQEMKAAGDDRIAQSKVLASYTENLNRIEAHYTTLKEKEAAARRDNASAAREEARATFASREAAIGVAGRELRKSGYLVGENNQFGGVQGNHPGMGNAAHGRYALDINMPGFGKDNPEAFNAIARDRMDKMVAAYQARGFKVLWNGKVYKPHGSGPTYDIPAGQNQHTTHAHMEAPKDIKGKPAGKALGGQLATEAEQAAEEARKNAHESAVAEIEFKKEMARQDLATVLELQDQKIALIKKFHGVDSREAIDAQRERIRIERQSSEEIKRIKTEEIQSKLAKEQAAADRMKSIKAQELEFRRMADDFLLQNGMITEEEGFRRKQNLLMREMELQTEHENNIYNIKVESLRSQMNLANLLPEERRRINQEIEAEQLRHEQAMFGIQQDFSRQKRQIDIQSSQFQQDQWNNIRDTLRGSFEQTLDGIWNKTLTMQQAFINMADAMVGIMFKAGAKMLADWVMNQVRMLFFKKSIDTSMTASHVASETAQTAATAAGATAQTGAKLGAAATEQTVITATTGAKVASEAVKTGAAISGAATQTSVGAAAGMAEIGTRAATSAAGAFSSTVVIPFIGPVAAPIAAAAALAAVLGFGALVSARGGQEKVPFDGQMTELHKDEMVLPAYIANPLRASLSAPSSQPMMRSTAAAGMQARSEINNSRSTDSTVFNYQPTHNHRSASMDELLREDGRSLRKWLKGQKRDGKIS